MDNIFRNQNNILTVNCKGEVCDREQEVAIGENNKEESNTIICINIQNATHSAYYGT